MNDLVSLVKCVVAEVRVGVSGSVRQDGLSSDSDKLLGHVYQATDIGLMITHFPDDLGEEVHGLALNFQSIPWARVADPRTKSW